MVDETVFRDTSQAAMKLFYATVPTLMTRGRASAHLTILSALLPRDTATCKFCGCKDVDVSKAVERPKCPRWKCNEYHERYGSSIPDKSNGAC